MRKHLIPAYLFLVLICGSLEAGTITGKANFDGTPPPNVKVDMGADPVCQSLHKSDFYAEKVLVNSNQTLKNVFVYIKEGVKGSFAAPSVSSVLDQQGCWYKPYVQGMQTGQKLQIINSDATLHNVHALAKSNQEFNIGMPIKGMKLDKTFSNPEVMIKFKCDVHPWMNSYVGVLPHPFFAVTDENGGFKIDNVPEGEYLVEAWHEVYGTKSAKVVVGASGDVQADFQFTTKEITDEGSGLKIKTGNATPLAAQGTPFDDSKALNQPRAPQKWWLPENISTYGAAIDALFYVILGITGFVFVAVQATLVVFLVKYRSRPGAKAHYIHGNNRLELIWTLIPALILVVLTLWSQKVWSTLKSDAPQNALVVHVEAEQFAWNVRYAGQDGKFNTGDDIQTINQLHIPVDQPVKVTLTSVGKDGKHPVLHSFFLPEVRLKQDVVPGMSINVWFEATRTGKYEIACAELCGIGHYRMRGFLNIHSAEGFKHWLNEASAGGAV